MPRYEWVEVGDDGRAIRIFKNIKACGETSIYPNRCGSFLRATAVDDIRRQIWERAKRKCEHCGDPLTYGTMEMHEEQWRGRGGEISLANGRCLCYSCHQHNDYVGHGKRQVKWTPKR